MKHALLIAISTLGAATLLAACGNYSNEDIGFYNALPTKEQLTSSTPTVQGQSSSLWGGRGTGPRTQNAGIGEHSTSYDGTRSLIGDGNGFVLGVLDLMEMVTANDATSKSLNQRIWGPVPQSPTESVEVVLDRDGGHYQYRLEVRPRSSTQDWVPLLVGEFNATGDVRHGVGDFSYRAEDARAQGVAPPSVDSVKELTATYDSRVDGGLGITLKATYEPQYNQPDFLYQYQETPGGPTVASMSGAVPDAGIANLSATAKWVANGAGHSELKTLDVSGTVTADYVECWDASANAVFQELDGFLSQGNASACQPPLP